MIEHILVGVDGSEESNRACTFAGALAAALGARVSAAHATGLLDVWPEHPDGAHERNSHAHVTEMMNGDWTLSLREHGVTPEIVLRDGPPGLVLLALADDLDVDLVVVGTRGVGQIDTYALGSTAARLVEQCNRPVAVVPPRR